MVVSYLLKFANKVLGSSRLEKVYSKVHSFDGLAGEFLSKDIAKAYDAFDADSSHTSISWYKEAVNSDYSGKSVDHRLSLLADGIVDSCKERTEGLLESEGPKDAYFEFKRTLSKLSEAGIEAGAYQSTGMVIARNYVDQSTTSELGVRMVDYGIAMKMAKSSGADEAEILELKNLALDNLVSVGLRNIQEGRSTLGDFNYDDALRVACSIGYEAASDVADAFVSEYVRVAEASSDNVVGPLPSVIAIQNIAEGGFPNHYESSEKLEKMMRSAVSAMAVSDAMESGDYVGNATRAQ